MFSRPSQFLKLTGLPLVCLAMFSVAGGHWMALQTVAWGQMLWAYSQASGSIVVGAQKTFSGEYPCSLCHSVEDGKNQERKSPATVKIDKKEHLFFQPFVCTLLIPVESDSKYPWREVIFWTRSESPPVPVPIDSLLASL